MPALVLPLQLFVVNTLARMHVSPNGRRFDDVICALSFFVRGLLGRRAYETLSDLGSVRLRRVFAT